MDPRSAAERSPSLNTILVDAVNPAPPSHSETQRVVDGPKQTPYKLRSKLRESCNRCAESKVKCTKEQPICSRCDERDLSCEYSLSRRFGKRKDGLSRATAVNAAGINAYSPTTQPHQENANSIFNDDAMKVDFEMDFIAGDNGVADLLSSPTVVQDATFQPLDSAMRLPAFLGQKTAYNQWDSTGFASSSESLGDGPSPKVWNAMGYEYEDLSMTDQIAPFPFHEQQHFLPILSTISESHSSSKFSLSTYSKETSAPSLNFMTDVQYGSQCRGASAQVSSGIKHCMARVLAILANLHDLPSACSSAQTSPFCTPGIETPAFIAMDQGLPWQATTSSSSSSSAADFSKQRLSPHPQPPTSRPSINQVLATNEDVIHSMHDILQCSCSADLQVALVMTSITSTVIDRYVAIVKAGEHGDDGTQPVVHDSDDGNSDRNQVKVRIQLILGEMHQVLRLIEGLAAKFEWIQSADRDDSNTRSNAKTTVPIPEGLVSSDVEGQDFLTRHKSMSSSSAALRIDSAPMLAELQKYLRNQLRLLTKIATGILRGNR